jgi:hypothetical protein
MMFAQIKVTYNLFTRLKIVCEIVFLKIGDFEFGLIVVVYG